MQENRSMGEIVARSCVTLSCVTRYMIKVSDFVNTVMIPIPRSSYQEIQGG